MIVLCVASFALRLSNFCNKYLYVLKANHITRIELKIRLKGISTATFVKWDEPQCNFFEASLRFSEIISGQIILPLPEVILSLWSPHFLFLLSCISTRNQKNKTTRTNDADMALYSIEAKFRIALFPNILSIRRAPRCGLITRKPP